MKPSYSLAGWMIPCVAACLAACSDGGMAPADTTPDSRAELLDPNTCNQCHQDHFKEWSGSMHAYASIDPVFRAMNARGQKETNGMLGDFCVKCHAPLAVSEGATTDGTNLDSVPEKLQGVTCYFCHNVTEVTDTHNNPLKLAGDVTMRGAMKNPLKYKGHDAAYSPLFDDLAAQAGFASSGLCGSCHDISVPAHFSGAKDDVAVERTFAEWNTSVFADPNSDNLRLNCASGGCHMDREQLVPIANPPLPHPTMPTRTARHLHDFPAIDTALTDFPEKDAQLAAVKKKLETEFRIQVCADGPDGITNSATVALENLSAGHFVPSGASQDRRFWIELHAFDAQNKELASSGVVPDGVAATTVPDTWILYDQAFKADGVTPAHMFWDIASHNAVTIPVSTTANGGANVLSHKPFSGIISPARVTVTIWIEPIGLDVIEDMIDSTFLDASFKTKVQRFPVLLASDLPGPTPVGTPVTFDWTLAKATDPTIGYRVESRLCVENTQPFLAPNPAPQQ